MRTARLAALSALVVWIAAESASAFTVTLNPGDYHSAVNLQTRQGAGAATNLIRLPTAVPESDAAVVTHGASSSTTNWSLSNAAFHIVFEHARAVEPDSYSLTYTSLLFTVDEEVEYVLSGSYSAADETGRYTFLRSYFFDYTDNLHLFNSEQLSLETPNEGLTLGTLGGDAFNAIAGSLTGTLFPGHDYQLFLISSIENQGEDWTDAPATATGSLTLTFVPEPSSALLLGGGLLALASARARRRS